MRRAAFAALVLMTLGIAPLRAQAPPPDLLALVPGDFGFCLTVHDLRGHWQRLEQAPWVKAFKQSPLGEALRNAPEFRELTKFQRDLQQHLEVDWPTVRDEIIGDDVVFAFRPPDAQKQGEQGLLLVKARQPEALEQLIKNLNRVQSAAGELKALDTRQHQGVTYHRRVHAKGAPWWYMVQGPVFALASSEATLKAVIERPTQPAAVRPALRRAGAERALAALWINPRFFDAELKAKAQQALGADGKLFAGLLEHWKALDGVLVAIDVQEDVELRLSLLARPGDLPAAAKEWFTRRGQTSELWERLPANSIFTLAGRTDFRALADGMLELAPPAMRKVIVDAVGKNVGAAVGLDPLRDVLPNIGPDWGVCVLPAQAGKDCPQALTALAVKPGPKEPAVDKSLYGAIQFFVRLALFEHNRSLDDAEKIQMRVLRQGEVEVNYLTQNRRFPPGFQPAFALKDGYLLLATSPAAVEQFQRRTKSSPAAADEVLMLRLAPSELAQLVRFHRDRVVEQMVQKSGQPKATAEQNLTGLLGLLDLCRSVTLSQRAGGDQLAWIMRLRMSDGKSP